MYEVFDRKAVSNYIFQDAICKGYSIHSPSAVSLWEMLLNNLLECFVEELGEIKVINTVPSLIDSNILTEFYGDYFYRIENRIPDFVDDEGNRRFITTDELPYLVSRLKQSDILFSAYTVVRPRSFAVKPFLREEFIRYFQFVISSDKMNIDKCIENIKRAAIRFFKQIRVSVILVDRNSDSYYSKKSCFHSVWMNGNIESVLQCGILRKRFDSLSGKDRIIIDIGGAQRMLASFIYTNSDMHGLFLPYHMRNVDIIIRSNKKTNILNKFEKIVSAVDCRLKIIYDNMPLKKIKKMAIAESVLAIVVQRVSEGKEFLTVYNRDMTKTDIYIDRNIEEWIKHKYNIIENLPYDKQVAIINSQVDEKNSNFRKGNKSYSIIKEGLFA